MLAWLHFRPGICRQAWKPCQRGMGEPGVILIETAKGLNLEWPLPVVGQSWHWRGRCECPVPRPKLPSLWMCQGG